MTKNITLLGASYTDVPGVELPQTGGGTAYFADTSDADAVANDIDTGKTAYVNGVKVTGTRSSGGNVDGILKGDGAGNISAAVPNVDYLTPFTSSASGAIATFYRFTDGIPISSCIADITPVQSGSGDPSPTNVRTISGWSNVTVSQSGQDISSPTTTIISLGRTVYGGTLNITTGLLTVTHGYTALSSLSWSKNSSYALFQANLSDAKQYDSGSKPDMYCSAYTIGNSGSNANMYTNNLDKSITLRSNASVLIVKDSTYSDAATFASAMGTTQLVYPLATSETYQLTATQIASLLGTNNIWADSGDVSVTFGDDIKTYIDNSIYSAMGGSY